MRRAAPDFEEGDRDRDNARHIQRRRRIPANQSMGDNPGRLATLLHQLGEH